MLKARIIPSLLLKNGGLVKTKKFKNATYVGDPINAVKIFNDKEVDELVFLDISATAENRSPSFKIISEIASECFMPLGYGGGISTIQDIEKIIGLGVEKIVLNTKAIMDPTFVKKAADLLGTQSVVVSIDVKKNLFGKYEVCTRGGKFNTKCDPVKVAIAMEKLGAGEILLNSIDRDGTMQGYDLNLLKKVTKSVSIPVIASGGAGVINHFADAIKEGGASAVAAGSMFVFHGKHKAVLINYPDSEEIESVLHNNQGERDKQ